MTLCKAGAGLSCYCQAVTSAEAVLSAGQSSSTASWQVGDTDAEAFLCRLKQPPGAANTQLEDLLLQQVDIASPGC